MSGAYCSSERLSLPGSSLEEEMIAASAEMDFERAARVRDQLVHLRAALEDTSEEDVMRRLKQGARKGSYHASRKRVNSRRFKS